jgi:hypothetical protein
LPYVRCGRFCIRCLGTASTPHGKSLGNVGSAEISFRQQTVMDDAEQSQIFRYRGPATRPRRLVVDLKKRARRTTASALAQIGAPQAVGRCDLALNGVRDVLAL